jgi:Tfp pilus assembly protein PilP
MEQENKNQPQPKAKELSLEEFSIEELEDRLELLLLSDTNCNCHRAAQNKSI